MYSFYIASLSISLAALIELINVVWTGPSNALLGGGELDEGVGEGEEGDVEIGEVLRDEADGGMRGGGGGEGEMKHMMSHLSSVILNVVDDPVKRNELFV